MTLDEAKQKIENLYVEYYRGYKGWDAEHPERRGDMSCRYILDGLEMALDILSEIDEEIDNIKSKASEPVGDSDKLTLTRIAHVFRSYYKFDYFVVEPSEFGNPVAKLWISEKRPIFTKYGWGYDTNDDYDYIEVNIWDLTEELDLSEYKDESGKVDYGKCIVEV